MINELKILIKNGKQFIPNLRTAEVPSPFRGRPVISDLKIDEKKLYNLCPTGAISTTPFTIDIGKCCFCGECAIQFPSKITFTNDHRLASNDYQELMVTEGNKEIKINPSFVRSEVKHIFKRSLKLRQVSAGGDNSAEFELNACSNANFDMGRFGLEFVASPRHADGILITGPITQNMAEALEIAYRAIPEPKLVVLCGVDAISGGIFTESKAINRKFLESIHIDLYIPGNPPHPLTIINGLLDLINS